MSEPVKLIDLEITGYADVLPESMTPSIVPPVFRLKSNAGVAYLPPYHMNSGVLYNATEVSWREVEMLAEREKITLLNEPFPARPNWELWVDRSLQPHYQSRIETDKELDRIGREAMQQAELALGDGDLERAERNSSVAACANDRRPGPFALQAAIDRHRGNRAGEAVMAKVAASMCDAHEFEILVQYYYDHYLPKKAGTEASPQFEAAQNTSASIHSGKFQPGQPPRELAQAVQYEMSDRLRMRILIEEIICLDAAHLMTAEEFAEAYALVDAIDSATECGDSKAMLGADNAFHRYLWLKSGSPVLNRTIEQVNAPLAAFYTLSNHPQDSKAQRNILAAMESKIETNIRVAVRENLETFFPTQVSPTLVVQRTTAPMQIVVSKADPWLEVDPKDDPLAVQTSKDERRSRS